MSTAASRLQGRSCTVCFSADPGPSLLYVQTSFKLRVVLTPSQGLGFQWQNSQFEGAPWNGVRGVCLTHTCADPGSCLGRPGVGQAGSESSVDRPAWLSWEPWAGHFCSRNPSKRKTDEALVTEGCSEQPPVLHGTPGNMRLAASETCLFIVQAGLQHIVPPGAGIRGTCHHAWLQARHSISLR